MSQAISEIFAAALNTATAAEAARGKLETVMLQTMRAQLIPGAVINLQARPIPEYLLGARVMCGNARGTLTFRIVAVTAVQANAVHPHLSTWVCDAVPISEKTGKDIDASTHAAIPRTTVRLQGNLGYLSFSDDEKDSAAERVIALVSRSLTTG